MPNKDFTKPLLGLNGKEIPIAETDKNAITTTKPYTMANAIVDVLLAEGNNGEYRILDGLKRAKAGALAIRLHNTKGVENYEVDELALIQERVKLLSPPVTTHRILPYLDEGKEEKNK